MRVTASPLGHFEPFCPTESIYSETSATLQSYALATAQTRWLPKKGLGLMAQQRLRKPLVVPEQQSTPNPS